MFLINSENLGDKIKNIYVDEDGAKTELILSLDNKILYFCDTESKILVIPDTVEVIGSDAISFALYKNNGHVSNRNLSKIICPSGLREIKNNSFSNLHLEFEFKGKNFKIGDHAFSHVMFSDIDLSGCILAGKNIFYECYDLENVKLPDNLEHIPEGLFRKCKKIAHVNLPDKVVSIGDYAFSETAIANIDISKIKKFGVGVFQGCENLERVILPDDFIYIPAHMFDSCKNLSTLNLSDNIVSIGDYAFSSVPFKSFDASTVSEFGSGVFKNCKELSAVTLPIGITKITNSMFEGCLSLKEFKLPSSVLHIGDSAFKDSKIMDVDLSNVRSIGSGAFAGTNLINVIWPRAVKTISDGMFTSSKISSISIPGTVTKLGSGVFKNCKKLVNISLPESISDIGSSCFSGSSIKRIKLPDKIKNISPCLFQSCVDLEDVSFSDDITSIGFMAFHGCKRLKRFIVPGKVSVIEKHAFGDCDLEYFEISSSKTKIKKDAFADFGTRMCSSKLKFINYFGIPVRSIIEYDNISEFFNKLLEDIHKDSGSDKNIIDFSLSPLKFNNPDDCSRMLRDMMLSVKKNEVSDFVKALEDFDAKIFDKNITYLKSLGISSEATNMLVGEGFFNILNCSFEDAEKNFEYLLDQRIINKDSLGRLFFDDCYKGSFNDSMKAYLAKYGVLPELVSSLLIKNDDLGKVELKDRLIYVSTLNLIDDSHNTENLDKAKIMMKRTLFKNIVYDDRKKMDSINDDFYNIVSEQYPAMEGIGISLYNKLNGIDPTWFSNLYRVMKYGGISTKFDDFYNALEMANSNYVFSSSVEKATYLKNEIVAKLLYADIMLTLDGISVKSGQHYQQYIELKKKAKVDGTSIDFMKILEYASKPKDELFKNGNFISVMLKIDPYAFDAFRVEPGKMDSLNANSLQVKYAGMAKKFGYLFDIEEVNRYKSIRTYSEFKDDNSVNSYVEFINNAIGVAKIPDGDKSKYLDKVRAKAKSYLADKDDEELFGFCRSLDLYLRSNNVYDREDEDAKYASKVVFDRDSGITSDSRVMYCLYNLNRLAHDTLELNCKAALRNKFRVATTDVISYEKMEKVFKAYNYLYRYGLDADAVEILVGSTRGFFDDVFKDMSSVPESVRDYFNQNLASQFDRFRRRDVCDRNICKEDVDCIRGNLEIISALSEEEKELINLSIKEQSVFFECKKLFSEEIINRLAVDISSSIKSVMNADLDTKRKFYAEHGFIAEVQKDSRDNEVLVCLCSDFNEPFSVHLKDLPPSIRTQLSGSNYENTIAHASLNAKGLTLRDDYFESEITQISSNNNFVGFKGKNYLLQAIRSNYDNYDVPAERIRAAKTRDNAKIELESMFSDETNNVGVVNTNTGSNKHQ